MKTKIVIEKFEVGDVLTWYNSKKEYMVISESNGITTLCWFEEGSWNVAKYPQQELLDYYGAKTIQFVRNIL